MRRSPGAAVGLLSTLLLASCGGGTPSATPPSTSTTSTTAPALDLHSVDWMTTTVPGPVCPGVTAPIQLSGGQATIPTPAGLDAGTPQLAVSEGTVVYGDLYGNGRDVAAVNVLCSNTGGTADGQLESSWVVFSGASGTPTALATLLPQQASSAGNHVAMFDAGSAGIVIASGQITTHEAFYGSNDPTCCPSGRATTVWTLANGTFSPHTTVQSSPS